MLAGVLLTRETTNNSTKAHLLPLLPLINTVVAAYYENNTLLNADLCRSGYYFVLPVLLRNLTLKPFFPL
jgi:hypothetical protein